MSGQWMTSATIHFFSGTGNTYRAASLIKKKLEEHGYDVELRSVEKGLQEGPSDLDIFAFPVYAYDMPDIMMGYIHSLPRVQNKKAAVLAVHGMLWQKPVVPGDGGDPGYSFEHARRALWKKGYDVAHTMAVGYPHSITMLLSSPAPAEVAKIREASDMRVEAFGEKLVHDGTSLQKCGLIPIAYSLFPGLLFRIVGRRGLGKLYVADAACIQCGKCVRSCPSGAIRFSLGRPRWGWNCQGCQRCINVCPSRAIQTSLVRVIAMFGALFVPWNTVAYLVLPGGQFLPHDGLTGAVLDLGVWAALYLAVSYILEKLLFVLEATPILGKIMSLNLSSLNRRYLDPFFREAMGDEVATKK